MKAQNGVVEGTAEEVIAKFALLPASTPVRIMIGRPSLSIMARRLQATATTNGMTETVHSDLLISLT
jgi:hypothetical protein